MRRGRFLDWSESRQAGEARSRRVHIGGQALCGRRGRSSSRGSGRPAGLESQAEGREGAKAKWEGAGLLSTRVAGRRGVGGVK